MEAAAPAFLHRPLPRNPEPADGFAFFLGVPVAAAILFSLVGNRLIAGLPYVDGLYYMVCHMLLSWSCMSAGAGIAWLLFRPWRPPALILCVLSFLLALAPAALLFHELRDYFAALYPVFAAQNLLNSAPPLTTEFILRFARYSVPALVLFTTGVYGYRFLTGVDWLGYPDGPAPARRDPVVPVAAGRENSWAPAVAGRLPVTCIDAGTEVLAVKAEQHYVHVFTRDGRELLRYRFKDVPGAFAGCRGAQVHRSWWVNLERVVGWRRTRRSLELELEGGLVVPVSHSQRGSVLAALRRDAPAGRLDVAAWDRRAKPRRPAGGRDPTNLAG